MLVPLAGTASQPLGLDVMHHSYDFWINISLITDGNEKLLCTLFADIHAPIRPVAGEEMSFHQNKTSNHSFNVIDSLGVIRNTIVTVEIISISHYASCNKGENIYRTAINCENIKVPTKEDAREIIQLLCTQHGFEIDPYGVNNL